MVSFFENLLISDTDEKIRNEAALILCHDYKEKAMDYFAFYYLNKPVEKKQLKIVLDK